jgi:hypothetical protein
MKRNISYILWGLAIAEVLFFHGNILANTSEKDEEWTPLVRGSSLDGWYVLVAGQAKNVDPSHIFAVEDGVIHAFKDTPNGARMPFAGIITEKEYSHFHLRLEYKWGTKKFAPRCDSPRDAGILYHLVGADRIWPQSVECQIQEDDTGDIYAVSTTVTTTIDPNTKDDVNPVSKLKSPRFLEASEGGVPLTHGSVDNVARVRRSRNLEREGWNTVDIIVRGGSAVYMVNGQVNNRCTNICRPDPNDPRRMIPLTKGKLLLQAEGAEVFYRNIEIKLLPESE